MTHPANKPENLVRRVARARRFPNNTCPASRHLEAIALALLRTGKHAMLAEEPEHCAVSMLAVLESLWKLRTSNAEIRRLLRETSGPRSYGHWCSDFRRSVERALRRRC